MSEPGPSTRVVRAGLPEAEQGEPFLPGPVFAAPFHLTGDPYASPNAYTRYGNPTWARYEEAVGGLESAEAVLFSSGMAAAAALLLTNLAPGSVLAMDHGCYHGVRALTEQHLEPRGVEVRLAPPSGLAEAAEGADLLWLESPSNPELEVYDLAALAGLGVPTVVDNTTAGALLQRPLDLGATYTLTSATKQMSGHADLMLGYVTSRDSERVEALRVWRRVRRRDPRPVRGLAGAPLAAHARDPAGARLRQRHGDRPSPGRPRRRHGCPLPGAAGRPGPRGRAAPDGRLRHGRVVRPRERGARRALPGRSASS